MVDLDRLREERKRCIEWKNIKPRWEAIEALPSPDKIEVELGDTISINLDSLFQRDEEYIYQTAKLLQPWRKGPFKISSIYIVVSWQTP